MPLFNPPVASVTGLRKGAGTGDQDTAAVAGVDFAVPSSAVMTPNGLVSGGGVAWSGTGLTFVVSAATYVINGVSYSSPQTSLTLGAADVTNPRIDVIAVDTTSSAIVIAGTAAASPVAPSVDPSTQLELTFIQVAANATTPSNVVVTTLYAENVEDTSSVSANFNAASTNNPHGGTKDIEATSAVTGNFVQLQKASGSRDLSTQNTLVFFIRSKAAWAKQRSLTIGFYSSGTLVGNALTFADGSFGFSSSNTTSYQQIIIPISQFGAGSTVVNQLKFTVAGSGANLGFYLDDISLQSGVNNVSQTYMLWRGTWNSTTAYAINDAIIRNGIAYVALAPNTNSAPTSTNTNWSAVSAMPRTISITVDGLGGVPSTGAKGYFTVPYSGKITGWSIAADGSSPTCTFDVWKVATGTALPTVSNTIMGTKPALATGNAIRSTTLTGWNPTTFSAGDIYGFNLDAVTVLTRVTLILETLEQ